MSASGNNRATGADPFSGIFDLMQAGVKEIISDREFEKRVRAHCMGRGPSPLPRLCETTISETILVVEDAVFDRIAGRLQENLADDEFDKVVQNYCLNPQENMLPLTDPIYNRAENPPPRYTVVTATAAKENRAMTGAADMPYMTIERLSAREEMIEQANELARVNAFLCEKDWHEGMASEGRDEKMLMALMGWI